MDKNPFLGAKRKADIFIGLFVILFLLVDGLVLFWGSASAFQRLGSLWVALLLLAFGLMKFIVSELSKAVSGRGELADYVKEVLDPFTYSEDKGWLNFGSKDGVEYEAPLRTKDEIRYFTRELEDRVLFSFVPNELLLGAIATLQWGYGDLFFCLIHGKGWTSC